MPYWSFAMIGLSEMNVKSLRRQVNGSGTMRAQKMSISVTKRRKTWKKSKIRERTAQALPGATIPLDSNGAHSGDSEVKKRARSNSPKDEAGEVATKRQKGVAPIKAESVSMPRVTVQLLTLGRYLIHRTDAKVQTKDAVVDDDAAEAADDRYHKRDARDGGGKGKKDKNNNKKQKGVPKGRPREDLTTFDGKCPIHQVKGYCHLGWKCRFVGSHSKERDTEDGRKELVLIEDSERTSTMVNLEDEVDVANVVSKDVKIGLAKRKINTPRSDQYMKWIDSNKDTERAIAFRPSEKRRLYYGPETPSLAPLTTQGNMPYRRLCVDLGCQITWSEMAMGMPLIQGERGEWALMKAHESEISPPKFLQKNTVVQGYDNASDMKFGAQIAANKPWLAAKTVEVLTDHCPKLRAIDLNCDVLSSAATRLFNPAKGTSGVAAITLHGRSKQQRYSRSADWSYIAECASLIKRLKSEKDARTDTIAEADPRDLANGGHVYFVGNGDCYSHEDYYNNINNSGVDSVLIGRGALIKPWIFEEIEKGQYLDKSATERLTYIEKFAKYGLQTWARCFLGPAHPNFKFEPKHKSNAYEIEAEG
ncbi:FMN-linked oxidoreductase [Lizonia empirigonia]|nr:FMN-linked oxidoreductase [Lizonia empirigonia]